MGFMNENPRTRMALVGGVILGLIAAAGAYSHYAGRESTDNAQVDGHITPVAARVGGMLRAQSARNTPALSPSPMDQVAASIPRRSFSTPPRSASNGCGVASTPRCHRSSTSNAAVPILDHV